LGHVVTNKGVKPDPHKIQAINDLAITLDYVTPQKDAILVLSVRQEKGLRHP